jgi:hypothetical protein
MNDSTRRAHKSVSLSEINLILSFEECFYGSIKIVPLCELGRSMYWSVEVTVNYEPTLNKSIRTKGT